MHFKDGVKISDDGRRIAAKDHCQFVSSNGHTLYTVTCWADGAYSCNCPAWAFRKKCKHVGDARAGFGTSIAAPAAVVVSFRPEPVRRARRLIGDED